jgi:hypothetical protein
MPARFIGQQLWARVYEQPLEVHHGAERIAGVASSLLTALKHNRKAMGIEREINYINEAKSLV